MSINIQVSSSSTDLPADTDIDDWIRQTLVHANRVDAEVTLRVVDESEITDLNRVYRDKNSPTDVLAFPNPLPQEIDMDLLGDVVVCAGIINQHAFDHKISQSAHWARVIAHGILHLCGYDHAQPDDATHMERAEAEILKQVGLVHAELLRSES
ncbi:MAG: rRNA maturation RNase YbeY [Acidiferrobacterales bacterium]|nr:rRNA maturation RNase YbeY [Acidiferrobacterales bacterium]